MNITLTPAQADLIRVALLTSKPTHSHYSEPVARHKAALDAITGALDRQMPRQWPDPKPMKGSHPEEFAKNKMQKPLDNEEYEASTEPPKLK
jgi:hypothetical protein